MHYAGPGEADAPDPDPVPQRLLVAENEVEPPLAGADDDCPGILSTRIADGGSRDRAHRPAEEVPAALRRSTACGDDGQLAGYSKADKRALFHHPLLSLRPSTFAWCTED